MAKNREIENIIREKRESRDVVEFYKDTWKRELERPDSARPVMSNRKFREYIDKISADGVIPGTLTIGVLPSGKKYLVDGWHRMTAFDMSGRSSVISDVHYVDCRGNREISKLFLAINEPIRAVNVGDKLRAIYGCEPDFKRMVDGLPFVEFTVGGKSKVALSAALSAFFGSEQDNPLSMRGGIIERTENMTERDRQKFSDMMNELHIAWGIHGDNIILWKSLCLNAVCWFYKRMVSEPADPNSRISEAKWREIIMELGRADDFKNDYLRGRSANVNDLSRVYDYICSIARRLSPHAENGNPIKIVQRKWMTIEEAVDFARRVEQQKAIERKRLTGKRDLKAHKRNEGGMKILMPAKKK